MSVLVDSIVIICFKFLFVDRLGPTVTLICLSMYKQHSFTPSYTSMRYNLQIHLIVAGEGSCNKIRGLSFNNVSLFFLYQRN